MWIDARTLWCSPCKDEQLFVVPPCDDGHGLDCPDLACTVCGHALVIGASALVADVPAAAAAA